MIKKEKKPQEKKAPTDRKGITSLPGAMDSLCTQCVFRKECAYVKLPETHNIGIIKCRHCIIRREIYG